MSLIPKTDIRNVSGIPEEKMELIRAFLQGAVYSWVKNRPGEEFRASDLVGGENFEWRGTPLYVLYEKHEEKGKSPEEAIAAAGRDLGWILKSVLEDDKRHFHAGKGWSATYRWKGGEP